MFGTNNNEEVVPNAASAEISRNLAIAYYLLSSFSFTDSARSFDAKPRFLVIFPPCFLVLFLSIFFTKMVIVVMMGTRMARNKRRHDQELIVPFLIVNAVIARK